MHVLTVTYGPPATADSQSPAIWRCKHCGAVVHPAANRTPVAWCARCSRFTESQPRRAVDLIYLISTGGNNSDHVRKAIWPIVRH